MSFFSKLVKGVGNVVKGVASVATGIVSKLNIPIVSGLAGGVSSLLAGTPKAQAQAAAIQQPIAPPPQTAAQAATFGGSATVGNTTVSVTPPGTPGTWTIFGLTWPVWGWLLLFSGGAGLLILLLILIFKRRR